MEDIFNLGLDAVFDQAIDIVSNGTAGFAVSFDLDVIDPIDAPGTGVHEPNGVKAAELLAQFKKLSDNEKFVGIDITEFNPDLDIDQRTEKIIIDTLNALFED